jgi:hypothetical protein
VTIFQNKKYVEISHVNREDKIQEACKTRWKRNMALRE